MITRRSPLSAYFGRTISKTFAALALACALSFSARAQIGSGWTPTTETYDIQTSAGCTATPLPSGSGIGGVFSVPAGQGRAEFRFQNLSDSTTEQFQGDVVVNSLNNPGKVTLKQTFGPAPSTPWSLIGVREVTNGTIVQIYEVETGSTLLNHYTIGSTLRINTIYNPNGGGAGVATVDVYLNGLHVEQMTGTGPNYNKIGAYVSSSGTGPATYTWQNVVFWTGGSINGGTPVAVDTPSFSPIAGTYPVTQSVTLSTTTSGASIAYTTDGSTPTESGGAVTHGTLYSGAISISATTTLNAMAFHSGQTDSAVVSAVYTINPPPAATPTYSPPAGTYTSPQSVVISSISTLASIAYTTDGSTPTESGGTVTHGTLLSNGGSVSVGVNTTLNAIAFGNGFSDSAVGTAAYVINLPAATPTFSPPAGTYSSPQSVAISSTTSNATIAYTTDGTTPTESGGTVTHGSSGPSGIFVSISGNNANNGNITLKAIAFAPGQSDSAVATGAYTISPAALPTFSPPAGTYSSPQSVAISSTTSGATIAYTTDGTTPTESGGVVTHGSSGPSGIFVSIGSGNSTLKAIAFAPGTPDSAVGTATYTIGTPIPTMPRINGSNEYRQ